MPADLDLATVEAARFEPLLHEKFLALLQGQPDGQSPVELDLVRVMHSPLHARESGRVPFSLFFSGPVGVSLAQGLYDVVHPQTGGMLLFLVPVASKEGRVQLQAVMN